MNLKFRINRYYKESYKTGHYISTHKILLSRRKVFSYYGFLGDNNFGDELVFEATRKLFQPHVLIPIKRRMPLANSVYSYLMKSDFSGIVIGGGTLIGPLWQERFFRKLINFNRSVFIHGTGVHEKIVAENGWRDMLGGRVYGGVRGPLSKKNLSRIKSDIAVAGDAAFLLHDETRWKSLEADPSNRTILINFGSHLDFEGQNHSRQEMIKFLEIAVSNSYRIQFIPFHSRDYSLGFALQKRFPMMTILEQPGNFQDALRKFKECSFAAGERLHFIVMAILSKRPFFSINYARKHVDLLDSIQASHAGKVPKEVELADLTTAYEGRFDFDWRTIEMKLKNYKGIQQSEFQDFMQSVGGSDAGKRLIRKEAGNLR